MQSPLEEPSALYMATRGGASSQQQDLSPTQPVPKNVAFELLLDENSKVRARIPMRVQIYPHDTTDSIVTTVKNFYGIYEGAASGVSFEDENGITLIARYENLRNNMTVYVRVIPVQAYATDGFPDHYYGSLPYEARKRPSLGEPFQMGSVGQPEQGRPPSRPTSRIARKRSTSPSARSRRSASQHKQPTRGGIKSRGSSAHGSFHDETDLGYSDSEGGYGSLSGAKKSRSEHFASSDISMDNILQDGRRKRPKFESSELPLFVPPQVPLTTSTSSISPQRRSVGQEGAGSPFARPTHRQYTYQQPLPSPQSFGYNEQAYGSHSARSSIYATPVVPEHGHRLRDRTGPQASGQYGYSASRAGAPGVLPTPDPTIASCISDEDVAMQLIRLGDASNFSHGRTSASTLDDAFSGAADAASSTGATSDGDEFSEEEDDNDLPAGSRHRLESSPMLPPGTIKRHHKRLDEILPSFDSTDVSCDDVEEDYRHNDELKDHHHHHHHNHHHHHHHNHLPLKTEFDADALYADSAPKAKKIKAKPTSGAGAAATKARGPNAAPTRTNNKPGKGLSAPTARKMKAATQAPGAQKAAAISPITTGVPTATPAAATTTTTATTATGGTARKASGSSVNFHHQLAADEEDLSTKPRCQRCRKSKKGCDRQRPCGRCRDAGIGLEGCISEDEGNGRKGRYGRHMGVPVKKTSEPSAVHEDVSPVVNAIAEAPAVSSATAMDKNKKRKR